MNGVDVALVYNLAKSIHQSGFGSIHATSITVTNAIFDLAARPEYIPALQEEIQTVLDQEQGHVLRKESLPKFRKMDSLLRESQRMNPGESATLYPYPTV